MIDDHAHPFPLAFAPFELAGISLDTGGGQEGDARRRRLASGRLFQELLCALLTGLLGLDPGAGEDEVKAARDAEARADWGAYVRRLFGDGGIDGMILDHGVSSADSGPTDAYRQLTGKPMWSLGRIDPLVDDLIEKGCGAREIVSSVERFMDEAAGAGAVGFKTIVAYRTGLRIDPSVSLREADASLGDASLAVRRRGKSLRDHVVGVMLERAADLGRPVQFHTGFGDSDIRLAESNPLLLEELLRSPAGTAASIVLIHGSYPWDEEAAYLATVHPNVAVEISLSNLFAPLGTADRLTRILDLAPNEKVLAGSDGHHLPETHWFGCRVLRRAFEDVSERLLAAGARPSFVELTRSRLFEENARRLYGLA